MIDTCVTLLETEAILKNKVTILAKYPADLKDIRTSNDSSAHHLLSESSLTSEEDMEGNPLAGYSESELTKLTRALIRLYEKFFAERSIKCLPSFYYDIIDSMIAPLRQSPFIDATLLDLFSTFLSCVQLRLFSWILNYQYHYFVITDLFEYLVNELQSPSSTQLPFASFRRATKYSMERLESCEAEIPHLSSFIQGLSFSSSIYNLEYSEFAIDLIDHSVPSLFLSLSNSQIHDEPTDYQVEAALKPGRSSRPRSTVQFGITIPTSPTSPSSESASNPPGNSDLFASEGSVRTQIAARFNSGSRVDLAQLILYIQQHHSFILFQLPPIPHPTDLSAFQNFSAIRVVFIQGDESTRTWRVADTITVPDFESSPFPRSLSHRDRAVHPLAASFLPPGGLSVVLDPHIAALLHVSARKPAVGAMERGVPQRLLPPRRSKLLLFSGRRSARKRGMSPKASFCCPRSTIC